MKELLVHWDQYQISLDPNCSWPWSRTGILPRILLNSRVQQQELSLVFAIMHCLVLQVLQHWGSWDVCGCPQYDQTPNTHHPPYSFQSPEFPGLNSSSCGWSQLHETSCRQHLSLPKSLPCVLHAVGMIWLWYMAHSVTGKVDLRPGFLPYYFLSPSPFPEHPSQREWLFKKESNTHCYI